MNALTLSVDRSATFNVAAQIRVTVDPPPITVNVHSKCGGITTIALGVQSMAYTLPADKVVELQIAYVDANGNPAAVDGPVTWDSSNEDIASVEPMSDPQNAHVMLTPGTLVGNCQISATADADLGAGVKNLVTLFDVSVVGGEAVAGVISPVGEPIAKP